MGINERMEDRERLINRLGSILSDRVTLNNLITDGEYHRLTPEGELTVTVTIKGGI